MRQRCPRCQSFVKTATPLFPAGAPCIRCQRAAHKSAKRAERAGKALQKLQLLSTTERWTLKRLQRAVHAARRRARIGRERWERFVQLVFGAGTDDLVDPRQMGLFSTETSCRQIASASRSHSQSA